MIKTVITSLANPLLLKLLILWKKNTWENFVTEGILSLLECVPAPGLVSENGSIVNNDSFMSHIANSIRVLASKMVVSGFPLTLGNLGK